MTLRISDHALVRLLERAGGVDFDPLRRALAQGLDRSVRAAARLGAAEVHVVADGLLYVVVDETLVTVRPAPRR